LYDCNGLSSWIKIKNSRDAWACARLAKMPEKPLRGGNGILNATVPSGVL